MNLNRHIIFRWSWCCWLLWPAPHLQPWRAPTEWIPLSYLPKCFWAPWGASLALKLGRSGSSHRSEVVSRRHWGALLDHWVGCWSHTRAGLLKGQFWGSVAGLLPTCHDGKIKLILVHTWVAQFPSSLSWDHLLKPITFPFKALPQGLLWKEPKPRQRTYYTFKMLMETQALTFWM